VQKTVEAGEPPASVRSEAGVPPGRRTTRPSSLAGRQCRVLPHASERCALGARNNACTPPEAEQCPADLVRRLRKGKGGGLRRVRSVACWRAQTGPRELVRNPLFGLALATRSERRPRWLRAAGVSEGGAPRLRRRAGAFAKRRRLREGGASSFHSRRRRASDNRPA
jgi:hypothetical protein